MTDQTGPFTIPTEDSMRRAAARIGAVLHSSDVLLLDGTVGMGKSFFSRALIQSLQDQPEDVPSPTFTLVQIYETAKGEIWHSDLYRISDLDEIEELGLAEAFETAICLIEWPDRLGLLTPANAVTLSFQQGATETARHIEVKGGSASLQTRITKALND